VDTREGREVRMAKRDKMTPDRQSGGDAMFYSEESGSLRRGKRRAMRTATCRPCLVWLKDAPGIEMQGVAMDMTPHGMLIRMMDCVPPDTEIAVQLMRDDDFQEALSSPVDAVVVRNVLKDNGFVDHGIKLVRKEIQRAPMRPVYIERRRPLVSRRTRMHTVDITVGNRFNRSSGK